MVAVIAVSSVWRTSFLSYIVVFKPSDFVVLIGTSTSLRRNAEAATIWPAAKRSRAGSRSDVARAA